MTLNLTLQISREKELQICIFMAILLNLLDDEGVLREKYILLPPFQEIKKLLPYLLISFPPCLQGVDS